MNTTIQTITSLGSLAIGCLALIVSGLALYFNHRNISMQIRKNSRVQWIDAFRINVVKLLTSYSKVMASMPNTEYVEQIFYIRFLLNRNDLKQNMLYNLLGELAILTNEKNKNVSQITTDIEESREKIIQITSLCALIIEQETEKI